MVPTLGAVLVGTVLLAWELSRWYPGWKSLQHNVVGHVGDLLPFFLSWCTGALAVMVGGGLVGWAGDVTLWGANAFGDGVLIYGVGADTGTRPGSTGAPLTQGGLFMAVVVLAVFFARAKKGQPGSKWRGFFCGLSLALTAGAVRYIAVPLASSANLAGAWWTGG